MHHSPTLRTVALLAILSLLAAFWASPARAADRLDPEQIKSTLGTNSQEEEGFIDRAVELVDAGALPRSIFDSCYLWARKKARHKFQYFKRALLIRAAEVGVAL